MRLTRLITLLLISIVSSIGFSDTSNPAFVVGKQRIELKAPNGFHEVTQISDYDRRLMLSLTPSNQLLLGAFYTEADIGRVLKQEEPQLETYILVKIVKTRVNDVVESNEFRKLKSFAKDNQSKLFDTAFKGVLDIFSGISSDLSDVTNVIQKIELNKAVNIGHFHETEISLSNAILARYAYASDVSDGTYVAAISSTFLLLEGKLLSIDIYALYENSDDLQQLRELTSDWMSSLY